MHNIRMFGCSDEYSINFPLVAHATWLKWFQSLKVLFGQWADRDQLHRNKIKVTTLGEDFEIFVQITDR